MGRFLLSLAVLMFSFSSHALTLTFKNGAELLAVDGVKIKRKVFAASKPFDVLAGSHQLVIRYNDSVKSSSGKVIVSSKPYIFTLDISSDTEFSGPNFVNQGQAESKIYRGLDWRVKDSNGIKFISGADQLNGNGFDPYGDIETIIAQYNAENGIDITDSVAKAEVAKAQQLASQSSISTAAVATTAVAGTAAVSGAATSNLEQLIKSYSSANAQERKAFRLWLLEQDLN